MSIAWIAVQGKRKVRVVKRIDIMDTLGPEFSQHSSASATEQNVDRRKREEDARTEEAELEQLAERVSAARSVY